MPGPRRFALPVAAAALTLLLLPGCTARQPIPSDPPGARAEAKVRDERAARDSADVVEQPALPAPPPEAASKAVENDLGDDKKAAVTLDPALPSPQAEQAPAQTVQVQAAQAQTAKAEAATAKPEPAPAPQAQPQATAPAAAKAAEPPAPQAAQDAKQPAPVAAAPRAYTVQVGAFGTEKNAEAALAKLKEKGISEARVVRLEQGQTTLHRVQAGPFQDLAAARKALEELKVEWPQAFIPAD